MIQQWALFLPWSRTAPTAYERQGFWVAMVQESFWPTLSGPLPHQSTDTFDELHSSHLTWQNKIYSIRVIVIICYFEPCIFLRDSWIWNVCEFMSFLNIIPMGMLVWGLGGYHFHYSLVLSIHKISRIYTRKKLHCHLVS